MGEPAEQPDYREIYTENYYSGKDSFFYKISGGYKDFRPYFNRLARWFGPFVNPGPVLDIGCAYGYFLSRFEGAGPLHGLDVSEHAIQVARQKYPDATFGTAILGQEPLPSEDNFFQTLIMSDVLEHLTYQDQPVGVQEVLRVLKPGGHWLITTPNYGVLRKIFYRIPDRMEHHFGMRIHSDWIAFLQDQGLELVDFWTYAHGMLPFRWRRGGLPELAMVMRKPGAPGGDVA